MSAASTNPGGARPLPPLPTVLIEDVVRSALEEDLGRAGDLTSDAIVPHDARATGRLLARRDGRVAGLAAALATFRILDPDVRCEVVVGDGGDVRADGGGADGSGANDPSANGPSADRPSTNGSREPGTIARVHGRAGALLGAERVALNLLGRLSGIATATRAAVHAAHGTRARITCTRKTTPGLRALEKFAVRAGGGANHRFGLDDAMLIKDNHVVLAAGVRPAIERARAHAGHLVRIEVEVDDLDQLEQALEAGADAILLDNMNPDQIREAVRRTAGRATLEASGGIGPNEVAAYAATGVDVVSLGWLTHSVPSLDVSLDLVPDATRAGADRAPC